MTEFLQDKTIVFVGDSARRLSVAFSLLSHPAASVRRIAAFLAARSLLCCTKENASVSSSASPLPFHTRRPQVNVLVYEAFVCEIAKEGYLPGVRRRSSSDIQTT